MEISTPTRFERLDGTGETIEYSDGRPQSSLLVYIDLYKDSELASVTVFDPYSCKSREWGPRPLANAEGIAKRHLARLGYTMPEPANPALTGVIDPPVNIHDFKFGIAGGAKYVMRCHHHHDATYVSKNPWQRSIFAVDETKICGCSSADLEVIWAPDDAH